jgi:hypothetical protein
MATKKATSSIAPDRIPEAGKAPSVPAKVVELFKHCGYLRTPPSVGSHEPGRAGSHRGYEVRFMAHNRDECQKIVRLLKACRIKPGKPFNKGRQWRVPVYGRTLFLALQETE